MEWNGKPSFLWDWENLFEFGAKGAENPKKLGITDCCIEVDRGISSGSLYSPGDGGGSAGTGGSGSDLGHASSRSSISASMNSSSIGESKVSKFTLDGFEHFPKDFSNKRESIKVQPTGSSPTAEVSAGSGEPLLSLKLGKRMYFKDICSENNAKTPSLSVMPLSSPTTVAKRIKSTSQSTLAPRCQVEGCGLELSSAKEYHRKHRICESHSKSPKVVVAGVERRFCQQCSRFHGLSEFDEKKRSCRKRLSDHNARRRKPQTEAVRLNPSRLSSLYDETPNMSLVFDQSSRLYTGHGTTLSWNDTDSSKFGHTREYFSKPAKTGQLLLPNNHQAPTNVALPYNNPGKPSPNEGIAPVVLSSGLEESVVCSEPNTSTPDLHRALSLLSTTSSWGSRETKTVSLDPHLNNTDHTSLLHPIHSSAFTQGFPIASDYWHTEQLASETTAPPVSHQRSSHGGGSHFQDLHLFKTPSESGFYSYQYN